MLEGQNVVYGGNRPWKNASLQNCSDPKPQLTARRPFVKNVELQALCLPDEGAQMKLRMATF